MRPEEPNRRLAAILSAEVAGYSQLMAEDQAGTIRMPATYREDVGVLLHHHRSAVRE